MSKKRIKEIIPVLRENLGLTKTEAEAYLPVFLGGNMTVGGVALVLGEKTAKVERALQRAEKKGLVKKIDGAVPVYRALPLSLAMGEALAAMLDEMKTLTNTAYDTLGAQMEEINAIVADMLKSHKSRTDETRSALEEYEKKMLETVQSQIVFVVASATSGLTDVSERLEASLNNLDAKLDDDLGTRLSGLQAELDRVQKQLKKDLKEISREFDQELKGERAETAESLTEFNKKTSFLIKKSKAAVTNALTEAESFLSAQIKILSEEILSKSTEVVDQAKGVLLSISESTREDMKHFDADTNQAYSDSQKVLNELLTQNRRHGEKYANTAQMKIEAALEIAKSFDDDIESWKKEVTGLMDVASQSVTAQIQQVISTDTNYLETAKNILSTYLEKIATLVNDEYAGLQALASDLGTEFEGTLGHSRNETLSLLQSQMDADQKRLESVREKLQADIDGWVTSTSRSVSKRLTEAGKSVGAVLDTEAGEMTTISEAMNSRLKSAFNTIISKTSTTNEAVITGVKKFAYDFEANIGTKLGQLVTSFSKAAASQVDETQVLYDTMNARLDERLAKSVVTLNSYADNVQQALDIAIDDQVSRIERHTTGIREEFHNHLEDITRQFISLTQGLESTFNGLLASQTVEASDLISSAHAEFKNATRAEMSALKEDSLKLQQEYSSEVAQKVEEFATAAAKMKKSMNDLAIEKRTEISVKMAKTLEKIDSSIRGTEDGLRDMQDGIIQQFIDNLSLTAQEFGATVDSARENIIERLSDVRVGIQESLAKTANSAKEAADSYVAEQNDSKQRMLADTSKKLVQVSANVRNDSAKRIEAFQAALAKTETERLKLRSSIKEEVNSKMEERRNEAAVALDAAAIWVESAVSNVSGSLSSLGSKLTNDIVVVQQGLAKAAQDASKTITEKSDEFLDAVEEMGGRFLEKTGNVLKDRSAKLIEEIDTIVANASDELSVLPTELPTIVKASVDQSRNQIKKKFGEVAIGLSTAFSESERAAETASEDFKSFLERISIQVTKNRDAAIEKAFQTTVISNQEAARSFESSGLDLKTHTNNESYQLIEVTRKDVAAKNLELANSVSKANNTINEETTTLRQTRNDAFSRSTEEIDKAVRRWATEQKNRVTLLTENLNETITGMTGSTEGTMKTLEALHKASEELLKTPTENTWYLTGTEEVCAHIVDMALRAENSVVISLLDPACLDLKQLAKVKKPKRRVLVIPESEEIDPTFESLQGWRIWQTKAPMLLAVIDDKEIVIGGARESDAPLAVASVDDAYLRLYHDVLGPRIVSLRESS